MSHKRPPLITLVCARMGRLFPALEYARNLIRAMRPERKEDIIRVCTAMGKLICLDPGPLLGAAVIVKDGKARPVTVREIARLAELDLCTVERCLKDMRDMKLIDVGRQKRSVLDRGKMTLVVSGVVRKFTDLFWQTLGLVEDLTKSIKYMADRIASGAKKALKLIFPQYKRPYYPHGALAKAAKAQRKSTASEEIACLNCARYGKPCLPGMCSPVRQQICQDLQRLGFPAVKY